MAHCRPRMGIVQYAGVGSRLPDVSVTVTQPELMTDHEAVPAIRQCWIWPIAPASFGSNAVMGAPIRYGRRASRLRKSPDFRILPGDGKLFSRNPFLLPMLAASTNSLPENDSVGRSQDSVATHRGARPGHEMFCPAGNQAASSSVLRQPQGFRDSYSRRNSSSKWRSTRSFSRSAAFLLAIMSRRFATGKIPSVTERDLASA
jgi:hypothetical protein